MSLNNAAARLIAFYLPQFHPIPENDEWWGKGFTEWTNVAKAKPMFRGHYQPHIPADLGFYDLRVPETRIAQAEMAREYGIEAFCYYHYWFAGKRLLERPFAEVLESGKPDFPFCLCWANQTWTGIWHGAPERILIEQTYPGFDDHREHFRFLLKAFTDQRYVMVEGKPLFLVYRPSEIPEVKRVTDFWRNIAEKSGLKGLYLAAIHWDPNWVKEQGFDATVAQRLPDLRKPTPPIRFMERIAWYYNVMKKRPTIHNYEGVLSQLLTEEACEGIRYPCVIPNWDNTPRSGKNGLVLHGSTPELFRLHFKKALQIVRNLQLQHRLVFIKSWNEWAEGNHIEPDIRFGRGYLQVIEDETSRLLDTIEMSCEQREEQEIVPRRISNYEQREVSNAGQSMDETPLAKLRAR